MFSDFIFPEDSQLLYDHFENALKLAADCSIPFVKIPQHFSSNFVPRPYWTPDLSKAVAERRLALAELRRCPSCENLEKLKIKISTAQKVIRSAKYRSLKVFLFSINENCTTSDLWLKMKWLKGYRNNEKNHSIDREKSEKLLQELAPDFVCAPMPQLTSVNLCLESEITMHELENTIKNSDTAPGIDGISFSMIKNLPTNAKSVLIRIYNRCLSSGFVPSQWRDVNIFPIPKPRRDSVAQPDFRPISLISCICKTFHSILSNRIEWFVERQNLFSENMVGFRKSRSCYDNLTRLVSHIQVGFSTNLTTAACFIDIDSAYNNVDVPCLIQMLDRVGVGKKICTYLWSYLSYRRLIIMLNRDNAIRDTGRGLGQGDPISPLLFNIVTLQICNNIINVKILQYADDFVLYISQDNLNQGIEHLQNACQQIYELLLELGLTISPTKSKLCVFKKGGFRGTVNLAINNQNITLVSHYRYLGMWMDASLRWGKHICEMSVKVSKFLNILKVVSGADWGVHPKHLRRIYITLIRSRIDYASFLYDNSCKSNLFKLDRIQNQALRIIGGYIRTTPIHVMESDLCLPPLSNRRKFLASKFWLKAQSLSNNSTGHSIQKLSCNIQGRYWSNKKRPLLAIVHVDLSTAPIHKSDHLEIFMMETWVRNIDIQNIVVDSIPMIDRAKRLYDCRELNTICNKYIDVHYRNYCKIYTDGSKSGACGGAAVLDSLQGNCIKLRINSNISIMHIELIAIREALSYIESVPFESFVILTDSKSSLQHLARCTSQSRRGAPIAYHILELILGLKRLNKRIKLQWIPSHCQIDNNEAVDTLAKQACDDGISLEVVPLYTEYLNCIKEQCRAMWQEYFDERSREKGIWYRTIQPQILSYPWIENNMGRKKIVTALRLRSAHIPTNKFKFLMKLVLSPNCNQCGAVEDVEHILLECVKNESYRRRYFGRRTAEVGFCNSILSYPMSEQAQILYTLAGQCF